MATPKKTTGRKTCMVCRKRLTSHQKKYCSIDCRRKDGYGQPGAPTVIDSHVVGKLETSLQNGFTIIGACELAGISADAYYERRKSDRDFADKMDRAKKWAEEKARQNIVQAISVGDLKTSRWYLERKARKEFSTRNELAGVPDAPLETVVYYRPEKLPAGYWKDASKSVEKRATPGKIVDNPSKVVGKKT